MRRREGRLIVSIEIEQGDVHVLLHRGYLTESNRSDPAEIHDALYRFVSDSFWDAAVRRELGIPMGFAPRIVRRPR